MFPYIDEARINGLINMQGPNSKEYRRTVVKAAEGLGLTLEEAAILLAPPSEEEKGFLFEVAGGIKKQIYGSRVVLFAPLYLSNHCSNNCLYCGFRKDNKELARRKLSKEEALREARLLEGLGHKRLLLVCGESSDADALYIRGVIEEIYKESDIRRVNINVAPMSVEAFGEIKEAGIGTYQLFQETYHYPTYKHCHPSGKKSDYNWRISAFDRAMEAGIDDVGLGVLFGLYDYRFEVLALIQHAEYLEKAFGVGPHTISVPRVKPAYGAALANNEEWAVNDEELKIIVAVLRLALPYTGIILSTREGVRLRKELLDLGVSQISAGSSTTPGGYGFQDIESGQFEIDDKRTLDEIVASLCRDGFVPSFCTACYRSQRTGEAFMKLAKTGDIKAMCLPNALLTLQEYLLDFACPTTKDTGEELLKGQVAGLGNAWLEEQVKRKFEEIQKGARDLYF